MTTGVTLDSTTRGEIITFPQRGQAPDIRALLHQLGRGDAAAAETAAALCDRLWNDADRILDDADDGTPERRQGLRFLELRHELQWALAKMEGTDLRILAAKARIVNMIWTEGECDFVEVLSATLLRGLDQLAAQSRPNAAEGAAP